MDCALGFRLGNAAIGKSGLEALMESTGFAGLTLNNGPTCACQACTQRAPQMQCAAWSHDLIPLVKGVSRTPRLSKAWMNWYPRF
jgi:hypothetical protein